MSFDIKFTKQGFESACYIARPAEIEKILGECLSISSLPGKASRRLADIVRLAEIWRILDEYLLISSLPGKASRTLVDIAMLAQI